jgi:hypothetical protein
VLGYLTSGDVPLFPDELLGGGSTVPKNLLDLVRSCVVGGYHYNASSVSLTLSRDA